MSKVLASFIAMLLGRSFELAYMKSAHY